MLEEIAIASVYYSTVEQNHVILGQSVGAKLRNKIYRYLFIFLRLNLYKNIQLIIIKGNNVYLKFSNFLTCIIRLLIFNLLFRLYSSKNKNKN